MKEKTCGGGRGTAALMRSASVTPHCGEGLCADLQRRKGAARLSRRASLPRRLAARSAERLSAGEWATLSHSLCLAATQAGGKGDH